LTHKRFPIIGLSPRFVPGDGLGAGSGSVDRLATVDANNQLVTRYGGLPIALPLLQGLEGNARISAMEALADRIDGLLLQGGTDIEPSRYRQSLLSPAWPGDAIRDHFEFDFLKVCLARKLPILGICRGFQVLQVAFGGALLQDIPTQKPSPIAHDCSTGYCHATHAVNLVEGGLLFEWHQQARVIVNSAHHQGVSELAPGLQLEAIADDGVIEAFSVPGFPFVVAVQWHPEFHPVDGELADAAAVMRAFLDAAKQTV